MIHLHRVLELCNMFPAHCVHALHVKQRCHLTAHSGFVLSRSDLCGLQGQSAGHRPKVMRKKSRSDGKNWKGSWCEINFLLKKNIYFILYVRGPLWLIMPTPASMPYKISKWCMFKSYPTFVFINLFICYSFIHIFITLAPINLCASTKYVCLCYTSKLDFRPLSRKDTQLSWRMAVVRILQEAAAVMGAWLLLEAGEEKVTRNMMLTTSSS